MDPMDMDYPQLRQTLEDVIGSDKLEIAVLLSEAADISARQDGDEKCLDDCLRMPGLQDEEKRAMLIYSLFFTLSKEANRRDIGPDAVRLILELLASNPMAMPTQEFERYRVRLFMTLANHIARTRYRRGGRHYAAF